MLKGTIVAGTIIVLTHATMSDFGGHQTFELSLVLAVIGSAGFIGCALGLLAERLSARNPATHKYDSSLAKLAIVCAVVTCLSLGGMLATARTEWTSSSQPMRSVRSALHPLIQPLEQWVSRSEEDYRLRQLASLEPSDAHTHIRATGPAFLAMLDRLHMHVLDILYVDDANADRASLENQKQDALRFIASANGRATLCTTFDPFRLNDNNFPKAATDLLNQDFAQGAVAVKIWKNIGMEVKSPSGQYVMPDDPIFEPIYREIAGHGKTLIIHAVDPDAAWIAHYLTPIRAQYYATHPQWNMAAKADPASRDAILKARDDILSKNPDLKVIGAHFGSIESNLNELAALLQKYPNFAVDTSARVRQLVREPRPEVRAFFLDHQDQILYGTDLNFQPPQADESAAKDWKNQYLLDWRYFATADKIDYDGEEVEGLDLPKSVLKKLYHDNAVRWIPGIVSRQR